MPGTLDFTVLEHWAPLEHSLGSCSNSHYRDAGNLGLRGWQQINIIFFIVVISVLSLPLQCIFVLYSTVTFGTYRWEGKMQQTTITGMSPKQF